MNRRLQVTVLDRHCQCAGTHSWRKLIHHLVEIRRLFGPFGDHLYNPKHVFWKLDFVESSSRTRRFLIRNFKGSDHLGAAADYEDQPVHSNSVEHSDMHNVDTPESSFTANLSSSASILIANAISMEEGNENDEQAETDNLDNLADNQQRPSSVSSMTDQSKGPVDSRVSGVSADRSFGQPVPVPFPGYTPIETDEKLIIELSSLMVRPLKIVKGMFQVTTKRINFSVIEQIDGNSLEDITTSTSQNIGKDKDWSWPLSSLHQNKGISSDEDCKATSARVSFILDLNSRSSSFEEGENVSRKLSQPIFRYDHHSGLVSEGSRGASSGGCFILLDHGDELFDPGGAFLGGFISLGISLNYGVISIDHGHVLLTLAAHHREN